MARQFRFHDSQERTGRSKLLYATLLVLFLFFLDLLSNGAVRGLAQYGASHVWRGAQHVRSSVLDSGYFSSRRALAREAEMLRTQLLGSEERAAALAALERENELLRSLLHLSQRERGVTAPVASSFRSSPYGTFLIGAGEDEGVVEGSLVLSEGGFVVGRVSEARQRTSLVKEIFAGGAREDVMIHGIVASASGRGGGNARIFMPRAVSIAEGDIITAPAFSNRPVGLVGKVESDSASAEQTVYASAPVNLASLQYVYVVPMH
jgi:cell shape-determining protein MreC